MPGRIDQAYEADDAQFNQASSHWISTQFDHPIQPANLTVLTRHHLNELGDQIGWKSIEITLYACLIELGGNPLRLHCMPALSNWSNWVEIH